MLAQMTGRACRDATDIPELEAPVAVFSTSIKNYLLATMACLCVPGIGVLAYMAKDATSDVRTHTRLSGLVQADRALLLSVNAVRTTRGLAQTILMAEENPAPLIQKIESQNRTEIAQALDKIRATDLTERFVLADAIERGQSQAGVQIKGIYDDAAKPKAQRSIAATMPWYNAVGSVIDDMLKASEPDRAN